MRKNLKVTFWSLVAFFLLILGEMFIPVFNDMVGGSELFLIPIIIFFILGIVLIVLTFKEKVQGMMRNFLILTGASAAGFLIFVFLHNLFYAFAELTSQITALKYVMEALHAVFFLISLFACPTGFLVGVLGTLILCRRRVKKIKNSE